MDSLNNTELKELAITGPIDVTDMRQTTSDPPKSLGKSRVVILMGPTGAGKSSFVEAIAGPKSSLKDISSGQLEGYTQDVSAYNISGVDHTGYTVFLIDTPGFADKYISAFEIVTKVRHWMKQNCCTSIFRVIYFTPISSVRLPGTQREVLKTIKALTGLQAAGGLLIVTTMWDTIWGESAKIRATANFLQLTDDVWKDFIKKGARITKFHNTQASALQVLDLSMQRNRYQHFHVERALQDKIETPQTSFAHNVYDDLLGRIGSLNMKKEVILADLEDISTEKKTELEDILESELKQVNETLAKFQQQLADFGPRPSPPLPDSTEDTEPPLQRSPPQPIRNANIAPSHEKSSEPKLPKGRVTRMRDSTKHLVKKAIRREDPTH